MSLSLRKGLLAGLMCLMTLASSSASDLSQLVKDAGVDPSKSSLIIVRLSDGTQWISNPARTETPFSPASTSKIPHTLIALETGLAGPETIFAWDGKKRFADAWNQDQTLTTAFERSAVWVYQEIAAALGSDVMSTWLGRFNYGNQDIGKEKDLTTYWLKGPLQISARQQVQFLTKLVKQTLPLSDGTYGAAQMIMLAETGGDWRVFAKTGWRHDKQSQDIGWYVGWAESSLRGLDETYVFAFNMDINSRNDLEKRSDVVFQALSAIGALPAGAGR